MTRLPTGRSPRSDTLLMIALCALSTLSPGAVSAQGFSVGPVRIAMTTTNPSSGVEVRSGDFTSPILVQATAFTWSETDGHRELVPTDELVVTPAVFRLAPGGVRTVMVSASDAGEVSRYYRIRIEEVADEASSVESGVQLRMLRAFDLPVFVETPDAQADVVAEAVGDPRTGETRIRLRNDGRAYAVGTAVRLLVGESELTQASGLYYLLPGSTREIVLSVPDLGTSLPPLGSDAGPELRFQVDGGRGELLIEGPVRTLGR